MSSTTFAHTAERFAAIAPLLQETFPEQGTFYIASTIGEIVTHATAVLQLNAAEQAARSRTHRAYVTRGGTLDASELSAAARLSHEANDSRMQSRYLLGQNQLFGLEIRPRDILVVTRPNEQDRYARVHVPAAEQAGLIVTGYQLHFGIHNQPIGHEPLVYLTESEPAEDTPTGIEVGISLDRLGELQAVQRVRAQEIADAAGQLTLPTGSALYATRM